MTTVDSSDGVLAPSLALDEQLCFPIYAATHLLTKAYRPLLEPLGLTYPQYLVMLVLWEQDGITVGDLGQRLYLDSGTLTPLLKRLQSQALISRKRCSNDERRVRIWLSEDAKQLYHSAKSVPETLACLLSGDPEWIVTLRTDLKRLVAMLAPTSMQQISDK